MKGVPCASTFLSSARSHTPLLCNLLWLACDYETCIIHQFACKYQAKPGDEQGALSPLNLQVRCKLDEQ